MSADNGLKITSSQIKGTRGVNTNKEIDRLYNLVIGILAATFLVFSSSWLTLAYMKISEEKRIDVLINNNYKLDQEIERLKSDIEVLKVKNYLK